MLPLLLLPLHHLPLFLILPPLPPNPPSHPPPPPPHHYPPPPTTTPTPLKTPSLLRTEIIGWGNMICTQTFLVYPLLKVYANKWIICTFRGPSPRAPPPSSYPLLTTLNTPAICDLIPRNKSFNSTHLSINPLMPSITFITCHINISGWNRFKIP